MTNDTYLRAVLTVIAAALVYLCVLLTPLPSASAQVGQIVGAPTPGVSTGPGEMVIVGWKVPEIPVIVTGGEVRVSGRVDAHQPANTVQRTTLVGWEERARANTPGAFRSLDLQGEALPVSVRQPKP
jgi:hypothetical protein